MRWILPWEQVHFDQQRQNAEHCGVKYERKPNRTRNPDLPRSRGESLPGRKDRVKPVLHRLLNSESRPHFRRSEIVDYDFNDYPASDYQRMFET